MYFRVRTLQGIKTFGTITELLEYLQAQHHAFKRQQLQDEQQQQNKGIQVQKAKPKPSESYSSFQVDIIGSEDTLVEQALDYFALSERNTNLKVYSGEPFYGGNGAGNLNFISRMVFGSIIGSTSGALLGAVGSVVIVILTSATIVPAAALLLAAMGGVGLGLLFGGTLGASIGSVLGVALTDEHTVRSVEIRIMDQQEDEAAGQFDVEQKVVPRGSEVPLRY